MAFTLRGYQDRAVNLTASYHAAHPSGRLLLVLPPAAGKTAIGARVILTMVYEKGLRGLAVAHRREIVNSNYSQMVADGIPPESIGVIMAGDPRENPGAPIQVASVDTLLARGQLPPADMLWLDESHLDAADRRGALIDHYRRSGAFILGTTATPERLDGKPLGDVYDRLEVVARPSELFRPIAEDGTLLAPYITVPRVWGVSKELLPRIQRRKGTGDFTESEADRAVNRPRLIGEIVSHWKKRAKDVRTFGFAASVSHSRALVARFVDAGIAAEHLDGGATADQRAKVLGNLRSGRTKVVWSRDLLTTGVNIPPVRCVVLARPTQSIALHIQMCGRAFRLWRGAPSIILDHAGNYGRTGLGDPLDDKWEWSLDGRRKGTGPAPWKTCDVCGAMCPTGCAECPEGHPFDMSGDPTEDHGAELVDLTEQRRAEIEAEVRTAASKHSITDEGWIRKVIDARLGRAA